MLSVLTCYRDHLLHLIQLCKLLVLKNVGIQGDGDKKLQINQKKQAVMWVDF